MIDTSELMRENLLVYGDDIVSVLTIAKSSLRVYNVTQDNYIQLWVNKNKLNPLPIYDKGLSSLGFYKSGNDGNWYKEGKTNSVKVAKIKDSDNYILSVGFLDKYMTIRQVDYMHDLKNFLSLLKWK